MRWRTMRFGTMHAALIAERAGGGGAANKGAPYEALLRRRARRLFAGRGKHSFCAQTSALQAREL